MKCTRIASAKSDPERLRSFDADNLLTERLISVDAQYSVYSEFQLKKLEMQMNF
jgi:hypothetical protein